jgi:hypothetical protein
MRALLLSASLLVAMTAEGFTQPSAMGGAVMPPVAAPQGDNPSDYLRAAQGALAAGHTRDAQEALEMAQTRLLDRSVPQGQTNSPSDNPAVGQISEALRALAARDRVSCLQLIQAAITSAAASGL